MDFIKEFKTFALRGNALDLAVGVVIGAAFNSIVTSLVTNILTPPLGLIIGGVDFSDLELMIGGEAAIQYGLFIEAIISFIITAFALFLLIKAMNKFVTKPDVPVTKPAEVLLLEEIRDLLKK
ncbi:MAG: large conductance mechanosensitive channel protein MscL [Patescibacteria group bacterium]